MPQRIKQIAILVDDYDKAIDFYTEKLHFVVIEDTVLDEKKRWVVIAPNPLSDFCLLLAKAANEVQQSRIGNQTGGRVFLFLYTTNFEKDHQNLIQNKISIIREPKIEPYGKVLVFEDCYGNLWDLIEPVQKKSDNFNATAILKLKDQKICATAKKALLELQKQTWTEEGNLSFTVQQSVEDSNEFIIWESFVSEKEFESHRNSEHLKTFLALDYFEFVKGYNTKTISLS